MHSVNESGNRGNQVMVASPRCILNCQALSIHLPPLCEPRNTSAGSKYLTPPMSASPGHSKFADSSQQHHAYHREYTLSPTSAPSGSGKPSIGVVRHVQSTKDRAKDPLGETGTPLSSAGSTTARTSLHQSSAAHPVREMSNDELSSINQDSPETHHLTAGAPGVARRAKAHVPSACVNCKRKHLACETRRPCNRCVQTGKEATCVDVQHKKRGRPRLREEENVREVAFGSDYHHAELYPNRTGVVSVAQPGRQRSKSYRELRSQPDSLLGSQRPKTSDPSFPHHQQFQAGTRFPVSPTASYLSESIPTVLLTTDFVVAQHNYAFADALSLSVSATRQALVDLVIPSEREKIQRLQTVLRAELHDAARLAPMHGSRDARGTMPAIEELDIVHATSGFRTRSEYWMFRSSDGQSRGFPITISLARTGAYYIILTLVQNTTALKTFPSPRTSHGVRTQQLPSPSSVHGTRSPSLDRYSAHQPHHDARGSLAYSTQLPPAASDNRTLLTQPSHSSGLAQYRHRSPQRAPALPYGVIRTSSGSEVLQRPEPHAPQDSLRHLQLPPIRTTGAGMIESRRSSGERGRTSSGKQSPAKGSPQSGRKKKRRRVDIGEMLR